MSEQQTPTGRTPWDLAWESLRGLSWSRVATVLITVVLLLPILKLYVTFLPEIFPGGVLQSVPTVGAERYSFLLPANALWVDSGIIVNKNDKIVVRVSGAVNLAAHRLVWSSLADTRPSMEWVVYPGQPVNPTGIDPERIRGALDEGSPLGAVVMYVCEESRCPTAESPRPTVKDRVFSVVTQSMSQPRGFEPIGKEGRLYFSVNDVIPDQERFFTGREDYRSRN